LLQPHGLSRFEQIVLPKLERSQMCGGGSGNQSQPSPGPSAKLGGYRQFPARSRGVPHRSRREGFFGPLGGRERLGAMASHRMLSGTWSEPPVRERAWSILPRTTCGELVPSCATATVASWNRYSSYWGMRPCRRQNGISAANKIWGIRSTISLTSERTRSGANET
jgi:hypothetical protein